VRCERRWTWRACSSSSRERFHVKPGRECGCDDQRCGFTLKPLETMLLGGGVVMVRALGTTLREYLRSHRLRRKAAKDGTRVVGKAQVIPADDVASFRRRARQGPKHVFTLPARDRLRK
jgi:hypothetical protein